MRQLTFAAALQVEGAQGRAAGWGPKHRDRVSRNAPHRLHSPAQQRMKAGRGIINLIACSDKCSFAA